MGGRELTWGIVRSLYDRIIIVISIVCKDTLINC